MPTNDTAAVGQETANLHVGNSTTTDTKNGLMMDRLPGLGAFGEEPPPPPKLDERGVVAMDITEQFVTAAKKLEVGQLIKDPFFTLMEAVGALEIMDPKMDSGYLAPGETMDDDYDLGQVLLPEEIIGIIDQLLCHEMAWQMGYPLAQTIFTSLYIESILSSLPTTLDHTIFDKSESSPDEEPLLLQILRTYCVGLIKTCFFVNSRVKSEHYYEEEDFVTHTFNRSLLEGIEIGPIQDLFNETLKLLSKSTNFSPEIKTALETRLTFRSQFLTVVETADSRDAETSLKVKEMWTELLTLVPKIKSTTSLGKPKPESFSSKLQRKLASTVPPRPIVEVGQEAAFSHLERLCKDAAVVVEVLRYYDSYSLMTFVFLFQSRKPQPSVYVRTLLQHYIFADMMVLGTMSIRMLLDDDMAGMTLPAHKLLDRRNDEIEVPTDPRHNMAARMEIFRARTSNSYLDILRGICQNRCRIRRTLLHTILDWDNLQLDAEELDQELRQFTKEIPIADPEISDSPIYEYPLSSWAYFYKLRQMSWLIQMGFELSIYQVDEYASMYWYLHYITKTRIRHLERIRGFVVRRYSSTRHDPQTTTAHKQEYANALTFINFSTMEATATYHLADALSCLFAVLSRLNLLNPPPRPYSNDHKRFEVRMKPFLSIGLPELIPLDDLTTLVNQPSESVDNILQFAADSVATAKKSFETLSKMSAKESFSQGCHESWTKDVKDCMKAAIFTGISVVGIKNAVAGVKKGESVNGKVRVEIPEAGKGYHDWWVVPKVVAI